MEAALSVRWCGSYREALRDALKLWEVCSMVKHLLALFLSIYPMQDVWPFDASDPVWLQSALDTARSAHGIPGMAAAVVMNRQVKCVAASGVRKDGEGDPVVPGDAFQIGSVAKSITAELAAVLSQKKILPLDTRILQVFPELKRRSRPEYRRVTVRTLLTHLAAFPYKPSREPADEFLSVSRDLKRRRYEYVKAALKDRPEGTVGKHYVYSGGTIIAAAMMERRTGRSWEQLVRKQVLSPLGMTSAGFGASRSVWEHQRQESSAVPVPSPKGYAREPHAPAGRNVHVSAPDLAKFMIAQFPYTRSSVPILRRSSLIEMQQRSEYSDTAPGWFLKFDEWSSWKTVYHAGDNGKSIALLVFSPKYEAGYVIMANISGEEAWEGVNELAGEIERGFLESLAADDAAPPVLEKARSAPSFMKAASTSNVFLQMPKYGADRAVDGNYETRWATDYGIHDGWLEIDLGSSKKIAACVIKEEFSPRVSRFSIEVREDPGKAWRKVAKGSLLGDEKIINFRRTHARFVRLQLNVEGPAGPTISEFQVFADPVRTLY